MSALLSRPISFPDIGITEQDQDPNSALLELDRGLKSSNVGEQCEAISRFPSLFEKYPFPILINSALLKLGEVFRQETGGSNFVRVCVCEVLEASARHLDKLINVDEFVKRICTVMHSNDPLARALTLRALGLLCHVVGEAKQVQHLVRDALDASHTLELQAAIAAAEKYSAVSKTFAVSMCERLTQMLSALSTPVEVKLQLIKVFQHMHHDADTAATVRSVCLQLLDRSPTQRVVITTLHALTQLAAHCLVHIPHQVDLVLSWVSQECRACVRGAALSELRYLASAAPHAWSPGNVSSLIAFTRAARNNTTSLGGASGDTDTATSADNSDGDAVLCSASEHDRTTAAALDVLATLTSAPALPHLNLTPESELVKLSREFVYDANVNIATIALQLYTNVALYMHEECNNSNKSSGAGASTTGSSASSSGTVTTCGSVVVCRDTLNAGVSLLHTLAQLAHNASQPDAYRDFKIPLVCCVLLARCDDSLAVSLAATLVTLLTDDALPQSSESMSVVMCEALASLGGSRRKVLTPHLPSLLALLHSSTNLPSTATSSCNTALVSVVCSVILQAYLGHIWDSIGLDRIMIAARHTDHWTAYRIARQAARYGHHQVACSIYNSLRSKVCSDQQHYWLTALAQVSSGETWTISPLEKSAGQEETVTTDVVDDRAKPLTSAATCLYSALANFKACSTSQYPVQFVQEYTRLRAASLTCHSQLITTCQSMRTSPPPAIAASQVAAMRDEMVRCCRLLQQLNKLTKDFNEMGHSYAKLYQSQFDADPQTLSNISALQQGAKLMAQAIAVLTRPMADHHQYQSSSKGSGGSSTDAGLRQSPGGSSVQEQLMLRAIARAGKAVTQLEQLCVEKKPIVECQLQLLTSISETLTASPLPYPRLYYQRLQHTNITLNITPQPRNPGDPITIQNSCQLAVKVEGVISHGRRPGLFRSVKSVTLLVNSTLQNRQQHTLDVKVEPNEILSQTVEPHNDFFSAQFLLAFSVPGQYQVTVDASVTDGSDETWQTGPRHSLSVKALDDPTNVKPPPPPPSVVASSSMPLTRAPPVSQLPPSGSMQLSSNLQQLPPPTMQPMQYQPPPPNMQSQGSMPMTAQGMPMSAQGGMPMPPQGGMPISVQGGMPMAAQNMSMPMQYQPPHNTPMMPGYPRPPL
uniref:Integrator complex subunit 7 n=2 Tax=Hirondellea gigas TaxID=1518452 RepID=A0A6A7FUC8_9CRUS